jgi:hypothetical protein
MPQVNKAPASKCKALSSKSNTSKGNDFSYFRVNISRPADHIISEMGSKVLVVGFWTT